MARRVEGRLAVDAVELTARRGVPGRAIRPLDVRIPAVGAARVVGPLKRAIRRPALQEKHAAVGAVGTAHAAPVRLAFVGALGWSGQRSVSRLIRR